MSRQEPVAGSTHVCNLRDAWPTGHPLPAEDPAKLQGYEVGEEVSYHHEKRWGTTDDGKTVWHVEVEDLPAIILQRSYVWSPGECRSEGGYRHYDWSVIRVLDPHGEYTVVVNDTSLVKFTDGDA